MPDPPIPYQDGLNYEFSYECLTRAAQKGTVVAGYDPENLASYARRAKKLVGYRHNVSSTDVVLTQVDYTTWEEGVWPDK